MFSKTPALILILCFLAALGLGFLAAGRGAGEHSGPPFSGVSYAALRVDARWPDRYIGELLKKGAESGPRGAWAVSLENYISESTQWVFLDNFGELKRIPLDGYRDRVETFDPRDDGYAERLRAFFVRDGERRFFLPLPRGFAPGGYKRLEGLVSAALGEIPFSLNPAGGAESRRPPVWYGLLFALAALAAAILARASPEALAPVPLLAPLISTGPAGFALGAILLALGALIREPLGEFFTARRYGKRRLPAFPARGRGFARFFRGGAPVFLLLYGGVCFFGGVRPERGLALLAGFCLVVPPALWVKSNRGRREGHVRFTPLAILERPGGGPVFPRFALPFVLASLLALLPFPVSPPERPGGVEMEFLILPGEYARHAAFQAAFSTRPLGSGPLAGGVENPPLNQTAYLRYYLGEDGLIGGALADPSGTGASLEIPPFPLEGLMEALSGEDGGTFRDRRPPFGRELVTAGLAVLFALPPFFRRGALGITKMKLPVLKDKRIAP
ncbi:MAG: hypothetical protein LBD09_01645 [Treponema sp.]|jgi:hypothetical protein|nr:hypothetical protein [Treponema sp.]